MSIVIASEKALQDAGVHAAPPLTDAERAAAIRAKVAELLAPALEYLNAQGKLGFIVDFNCMRDSPTNLRLADVHIAKVL